MDKLNKQLKNLKKSASPSREFKGALWSKLSDAYDAQNSISHVRSPFFRFAVAGVTAVVLFVSTGAGVYAYESPEVVEGHPLHFMKSGIENVEGQFAFTSEQRAKYHAKMMERRIREVEHHAQNVEFLRTAAPRIAEEYGLTQEELRESVKDEAFRDQLVEDLSEINERYAEVLIRVIESEEEFRQNHVQPFPPKLQEEIDSIREELEGQDLTPREKRDYYETELKNFLNDIRFQRYERIRPPSDPYNHEQATGDVYFFGTVEEHDTSVRDY